MMITPQVPEVRVGDTLTLTIEIPYQNIDLRNSTPVNIKGCKMSEFGIDLVLLNRAGNKITGEGRDRFNISIVKGISKPYTDARTQNSFSVEQDKFLYKAIFIPLKPGLINFVNYRAEGEMDGGCTLVDFSPLVINTEKNHSFFMDLLASVGWQPSPPGDNHYYVWVR